MSDMYDINFYINYIALKCQNVRFDSLIFIQNMKLNKSMKMSKIREVKVAIWRNHWSGPAAGLLAVFRFRNGTSM